MRQESQSIPYGRQSIDQTDIDAVVEVLGSSFITQGHVVPAFENAVAQYCNSQHAVAVNSATSALHLACLALGVGVDDVVWTVPNTFVATANCARYCGARVDFVDIESSTWCMSSEKLLKKLENSKSRGTPLPKVVIPVHFAGVACDMEKIYALGKEYKFSIIEDASHAIGGRYRNEPIGSCRYSDISIFSFHPVKLITTGEGGMALTNSSDLYNHMLRMRAHGITRNPEEFYMEASGPWYYEQVDLGFNFRMTDIHAALGLNQLRRLDDFVTKRNQLADYYSAALDATNIHHQAIPMTSYSARHLYPIRVSTDKRLELFNKLAQANISSNVHYMPVHLQPYYREFGFKENDFPESEAHGGEELSIPLYPDLTTRQQDEVINVIRRVLQN